MVRKVFHGLLWNSGYKEYNELNDVLKDVFKSGGTVYVKGTEKIRINFCNFVCHKR